MKTLNLEVVIASTLEELLYIWSTDDGGSGAGEREWQVWNDLRNTYSKDEYDCIRNAVNNQRED